MKSNRKLDLPLMSNNITRADLDTVIEFLRQPYLHKFIPEKEYEKYPEVEHIHFYGFYVGTYPDLKNEQILAPCQLLNEVAG